MKLFKLTKLVLSMSLLSNISLNAENTIHAKFETPQVTITGNADDPAIWVNEVESNLSIIFGLTNTMEFIHTTLKVRLSVFHRLEE